MSIEKRASARIAVPLHVVVRREGMVDGEETLQVRDVSMGGIFLYTPNPPEVGTRLKLSASIVAGIRPVQLEGEVVRVVLSGSGRETKVMGMGVQFLSMGDAKKKELAELLDRAMLGPGTAPRAFPRVYTLLQVTCRTRQELRAMLRDIGEGGVGVVTDKQLEKNEQVTVEITDKKSELRLSFDGHVIGCEPFGDKRSEFRVGVRFSRLTAEQRGSLQAYLKRLYR